MLRSVVVCALTGSYGRTRSGDLDAWSRAVPGEMQERGLGEGNNSQERPGMGYLHVNKKKSGSATVDAYQQKANQKPRRT